MNIEKLKKNQSRFNRLAKEEIANNIKENLIQIVLDDDLKQLFRNEKNRNINNTSKRQISHWVKKGLIKADQEKRGSWFYFNRTETIWIDIITELRKFGLDLDTVKTIREYLFVNTIDGFTLIEFALMYSILKEPYLMLVNQNGEIKLMTTSLYAQYICENILPPHITFNFFHLAKDVFPNNNFHLGELNIDTAELSKSELKLLYFIRTGDFEEVKVRLNEDNIFLVEGKKQIKNSENIMSVIGKKSYQDIQIKTENGRIVCLKSTEKIRI